MHGDKARTGPISFSPPPKDAIANPMSGNLAICRTWWAGSRGMGQAWGGQGRGEQNGQGRGKHDGQMWGEQGGVGRRTAREVRGSRAIRTEGGPQT